MKLTELTTVKARLEIDNADTADDVILTNTITALSERIENDTNRKFDYQAAATFQFRGNTMDILPDRFPVLSVDTLETKDNEATGWVAVADQDMPDILIGERLNVIELSSAVGNSRNLARVTYAAGYILPGCAAVNGVSPLPPDLEQAVVEQVCYWYQRRNQLGLVSVSGDGGSVSQFRTLDLLPSVAAVVRKYERMIL